MKTGPENGTFSGSEFLQNSAPATREISS